MLEDFMRRAIEIAGQSVDIPGTLPFGAVVVKDGEIIGEGLNRSYADCDPTSHGEVEAIRDACRRLGVTSLAGSDLYTSCEPCSMCVATMYLAGIERLYYAGATSDSADFFQRLAAHDAKWTRRMSATDLRREVGLAVDQRRMPAGRLLIEDARRVFEVFMARHAQG